MCRFARKWTSDSLCYMHVVADDHASCSAHSLPELSTGPHLVPNPNAAPDSTPLRALYMSRPDSRYITYPHLYFGPELLHSGDVLRLIPNVELPPSVARHVVEKPPTSLRTCLVVLLDCFIRGGKDAPLLARGRIYEMNEIDESAAGVAQDMLIAQRNSALPLDAQAEDAAALSRMPSAFPGHKWRNLAPGRLIDVLLSHVAGRFYSPPEDVQDDDALVNVIAEKARRTGVIGEEGTRAVGLLLGGMVSGARVPKITVSSIPNLLVVNRADRFFATSRLRLAFSVLQKATLSEIARPA